MKTFQNSLILSAIILLQGLSSCGQNNSFRNAANPPTVTLPSTVEKRFDGYSVKMPADWKLFVRGNCVDMSFIAWDPKNPLRQFFHYGTAGPIYLTYRQKQITNQYVNMGGMRTPWNDAPVIQPFTPENFLINFHLIADQPEVRRTSEKLPELYNVSIISSEPQLPGFRNFPSTTAIIRAVFTNRERTISSQGLFMVTAVSVIMNTGGPGDNMGIAYSFMGITAPLNEFDALVGGMEKCLEGFSIDPSYVSNCIAANDKFTQGVLQAGKTLAEGSNTLMKSWEYKTKSQDISSQKISDGILGKQRMYDPSTKQVYEFSNTFPDQYKLNPGKYNISGLQSLPADDYKLWNQPALIGSNYVRQVN